jgi:membrane fusion protein (multidrug efflux system)
MRLNRAFARTHLRASPSSRLTLRRYARPALAAIGFAALSLAGCGQQQQGGFHGFPPAPVTLLEVKTASVPMSFEYVGQTAGSKEAEVRARVTGILEKRVYEEGSRVKEGQTLFVIDPKPYAAALQAAEAELARAQAQLAQARRDRARLEPLVSGDVEGAVSQREYDNAVSAAETAEANLKLAQANLTTARLNLSYTTVTAPVSGFASRAQKSEGSLVSPGADSLLATVSQVDPIYVNFSVSENERLRLDALRREGKLVVPEAKEGGREVTVRLADGSVYPRKGRLAFIDARINPGTGSYDARAVFQNENVELRPGQFVRVILGGATRPDAIVVPQVAVMDGPQGKFVYVAGKSPDGKDVAVPRPVTVSDWVELGGTNQWIVETGLKAGDKVVVDGMAKLQPIPTGAPIALGPPPQAAGKSPGGPQGAAPKGADAKK